MKKTILLLLGISGILFSQTNTGIRSLNGSLNSSQKIVWDTTSTNSSFSITQSNGTHTIKIPYNRWLLSSSSTNFTKQQIDTVGTVGAGVWQATSIDTAYTNAVSKIVAGNSYLTATKIAKDYRLTIDTSHQGFWTTKGFLAKKDIDSVGTIGKGTWQATSIDTAYTNAVSKLTAGIGITATKYSKDYQIKVDTSTIASKTFVSNQYVPLGGSGGAGIADSNRIVMVDKAQTISSVKTFSARDLHTSIGVDTLVSYTPSGSVVVNDSLMVIGSGLFGGSTSTTARLSVKNGLLTNIQEWDNSRGSRMAVLDSTGKMTISGQYLFVARTTGVGSLLVGTGGAGASEVAYVTYTGAQLGNAGQAIIQTRSGVLSSQVTRLIIDSITTFYPSGGAHVNSNSAVEIRSSGKLSIIEGYGAISTSRVFSLDTNGRFGLGQGVVSTDMMSIKNGLYANAQTWYNSRGTLIAKVDSSGSISQTGTIKATSTKTSNYTATASDYTIRVDASSGAVTITLPSASTHTGRIYNIKKIDSSGNNMVIDANASELIDGNLTITTNIQYTSFQIQSNGVSWDIL